MKLEEVKENLCSYDKRNPNRCDVYDDEKDFVCSGYCDNCFYGRHQLANEILRLRDKNRRLSLMIRHYKRGGR